MMANDNAVWIAGIGLVSAGAYVAWRKSQPRPMSQDEIEALAPAPYTTEATRDDLTPEDFTGYPSGSIGLTQVEEPILAAGSVFPTLWQPDWNTPNAPAGTPPAAQPQDRQKGPVQMKLGTANIQNFGPDLTPQKVAADARKMGTLCGIWGGQEITPHEDSDVVLRALGGGWNGVFLNRETPIFYRSGLWEISDPYDIKLDREGMKKVNPFSAITSAAFESKKFEHRPFAVVNCHLMVGGFNRGTGDAKRKEVWRKEFQAYRDVIHYHFKKGRTVFFLGDTNHPTCPVPFQGSRWISHTRIDRIGIMPHKSGAKITRHIGNPAGEIHALNSDHSARVINVKIK